MAQASAGVTMRIGAPIAARASARLSSIASSASVKASDKPGAERAPTSRPSHRWESSHKSRPFMA
jgi:hypothetical protein